jgi:hypothetical protein
MPKVVTRPCEVRRHQATQRLDTVGRVHIIEDDKGSLTMLIAAAKEGPGRFAHAAQLARDARALAAKIAEATAKLERPRSASLARTRPAVPPRSTI